MPGIVGLIGQTPAADFAARFTEMAERLKHHSWYTDHRHLDEGAGLALGRIGLGFVNAAAQPAWSEDRSLLAVMEGEVYDYDEQRRALEQAGHTFRGDSHAELLLHGYEAGGQTFFQGLHGTFAAAIWEAADRRLTLVNDRFGIKPLYYTKLPGRLLVASEIKALLVDPKVSRQSNPRGIAQFFTYGQLLGEDTLLDAVRLLPAAGWLTYDARADRLALGRYWRLESRPGGNGLREAEALDRIDAAFQRAVDRRVGGTSRLGLSLSGGLDARTILAVIDHDRVPVTSVSLGIEGSLDHQCAQRLAALSNRRHHCYFLTAQFLARFAEHMRHMVHLTDGHYLCQCIVMPTLPFYRELGIEVLLRGHAGELLHMDKAYNFSLDRAALALGDGAGLEAWLFRHLRTYMLDAVDGPLLSPLYQDHLDALARESLRACLAEAAGIEPPLHRVWHLFISQRLRRETALSLVEFNSLVETRMPYLDHDLVDALLAVPPEWKLGDRIQTHILRRRRPAFLDVVNVNTGARLGAGPVARLAGKARLKVLAKLGVRGYQPYERLGRWLRQELRPLVHQLLLSDRCLGRGLFDPQTVKAVVAQHLGGQRNHTFLLLALMIFEFGQREFIDAEAGPQGPGWSTQYPVPSTEYPVPSTQ
jgi:asparagine synthase (glutamine-hydrolysing)